MIRLFLWLLSACWLMTPGVVVSAPLAPAAAGAPAAHAPPAVLLAAAVLAQPALMAALPAEPVVPGLDSLRRHLPDGAVASVHVPSGMALWMSAPARQARARAEAAGLLRVWEQVRAQVRLVTRQDPEHLLRFVLGGELALGIYERMSPRDAASGLPRELLALAHTGDADGLKLALDAVLGVLELEHEVRRMRHGEVRYVRVARLMYVAALDGLLIAATDVDLLKSAIDSARDAAQPEPVAAPAQLAARAEPGAPAPRADASALLAAFSLDAAQLQPADWRALQQPGRQVLGRRIANPLANLLFGGLTLTGGRIDGEVLGREGELALRVLLPAPPSDAPAAWFPAGTDGMEVPATGQTIAIVSTRRDLADWWRQRDVLMSADSQRSLARADENIGLLFAGLSPAEDVFAAVQPDLALVIDRQSFAGAAVPAVRLPALCLVGRLRDDAPGFPDALAVAFQSFITFLNMERTEEGQPAFLLDVQVHAGVPLRTARLLERRNAAPDAPPHGIDANWSPTVAIADDWLFIGSSAEQVRGLIDALHAGRLRTRTGTLGLDLDVAAALSLARENRGPLVAKRMLEQGAEPDEAGRDIDHLIELLSGLGRVRADVASSPAGLELLLAVALAPSVAPDAGQPAREPAPPDASAPAGR